MMSVIERLTLLLIGTLVGCATTLVVLAMPLLTDQPTSASNYATAGSIVAFIALGASLALSATNRKRASVKAGSRSIGEGKC